MMGHRINLVVLSVSIVLLFAATWLITGCDQENSPVSSDQEALLAPGNGNGNQDVEADDEGDVEVESMGKARGNPHLEGATGNPHTASNEAGDPHIDDHPKGKPDVEGDEEKPGKNKEKPEKEAKAESEPEETITYPGTVASVDGNDIILEDDVVINTWPKPYHFVDDDNNNGINDELEVLIGKEIEIEGEPIYDPPESENLVAIDAYTIKYDNEDNETEEIIIRDPGKPDWAKGPKP